MFKKSITIIISLFFLSGCLSLRPGSIPVDWIKVKDKEEATSWCASYSRSRTYPKVYGCQYWLGGTCIIVAPQTDHDTIGHELRHCFEGRFHKDD